MRENWKWVLLSYRTLKKQPDVKLFNHVRHFFYCCCCYWMLLLFLHLICHLAAANIMNKWRTRTHFMANRTLSVLLGDVGNYLLLLLPLNCYPATLFLYVSRCFIAVTTLPWRRRRFVESFYPSILSIYLFWCMAFAMYFAITGLPLIQKIKIKGE